MPETSRTAKINARIDRLPAWGLPKASFAILGIAYFVDIYDVSIVGYSLPVLKGHFHLAASSVTVMLTGNLIRLRRADHLLPRHSPHGTVLDLDQPGSG